jgi:DNA-binding MarR family transcriptional regulator/GNAT superfamily N-acetyltransferase
VLEERLLRSPFTLTESRLLYEIARRQPITAAVLVEDLGLDAGYVSRMLRAFAKRKLVQRRQSSKDRRAWLLTLTSAGRRAFARIDAASTREMQNVLVPLSAASRRDLIGHLTRAQHVLATFPCGGTAISVRAARLGDIGWVIQRHATLYAGEFGWNEDFERDVVGICQGMLDRFTTGDAAGWIGERDGEPVASAYVVLKSGEVAQLRLLLVGQEARGAGLGADLVDRCVAQGREWRCRSIMLETYSMLLAARRLYANAGFQISASHPETAYGHDLVHETWTKLLAG